MVEKKENGKASSAVGAAMAKGLGIKKKEPAHTYNLDNYGGYGGDFGYGEYGGGRRTRRYDERYWGGDGDMDRYSEAHYPELAGYELGDGFRGTPGGPYEQTKLKNGWEWSERFGCWVRPKDPAMRKINGATPSAQPRPQVAYSETHTDQREQSRVLRSEVEYIDLPEPFKVGTQSYSKGAKFSANDFEREMLEVKRAMLDVLEGRGFIMPTLAAAEVGVAIADAVEKHGLMHSVPAVAAETGEAYVKVVVTQRDGSLPSASEVTAVRSGDSQTDGSLPAQAEEPQKDEVLGRTEDGIPYVKSPDVDAKIDALAEETKEDEPKAESPDQD